jgi:hypothetical protein
MLSQGLYSTRLSTSSAQFRFNIKCYTDGEGFRRYGDSYLVAMGQAYGTKVGDKKLLSFRQDDGTTLTISAVSGDFKAIHDTDASNRYHLSDGTIVEFIMGSRDGGHMKRINDKFGQLVSIAKIGTECTLAGSIGEDDAVSLSGNIDGIGLAASGRYDRGSGRFTANGIYGNGGDLSGASADALRSADFAAVYAEAAQHLGKRYVLGTQGPDTFDCSGLVYYVYRRTLYPGLDRRTADSYFNLCARVTGTPMPGDLAFFDSMPGNDRYVDHVGIYIGDGKMLNAPNSKSVVRIESLWGSLVGYGRFPDALRTTR